MKRGGGHHALTYTYKNCKKGREIAATSSFPMVAALQQKYKSCSSVFFTPSYRILLKNSYFNVATHKVMSSNFVDSIFKRTYYCMHSKLSTQTYTILALIPLDSMCFFTLAISTSFLWNIPAANAACTFVAWKTSEK